MKSKKTEKNALQLDTSNDKFCQALHKIAARVDAPLPCEAGTKISKFKKDLPAVFDRVTSGLVEVITLEHQRFVILSEKQIIALIGRTKKSKTVTELFAGLPMLTGTPPAVESIKEEADQYCVPKRKTWIP